ncbi:MAG: transposase [Oligoflexia bacterium]|nr:transposase [Oligoflexia bacterium]
MLKEVYHSGEDAIYLRKLVNGYEDIVRSGVRLKNQRSAFFRCEGLDHKKDKCISKNESIHFILKEIDKQIELNESVKKNYNLEFKKLSCKYKEIGLLKSLPGIGAIHAVQILAVVVNIRRFKRRGHFLSYCGLIKHEKMSGGRSYGKRQPRYYRPLKQVFKMASHIVIQEICNNPLKEFYEYQVNKKQKSPQIARHNVARRLAVLVYGVLKTGQKFDPYRREKSIREKS